MGKNSCRYTGIITEVAIFKSRDAYNLSSPIYHLCQDPELLDTYRSRQASVARFADYPFCYFKLAGERESSFEPIFDRNRGQPAKESSIYADKRLGSTVFCRAVKR